MNERIITERGLTGGITAGEITVENYPSVTPTKR